MKCEEIFANQISNKGLISKINKKLLQRKGKTIRSKMGKGPKQTFSNEDQWVYENMLNSTNPWGNVNQNYNVITSHTY
jgi:hypothetical protein